MIDESGVLADAPEGADIIMDGDTVVGFTIPSEGSSELVSIPRGDVTLPTGELIDLDSLESMAAGLAKVNEIEQYLKEIKGAIREGILEESRIRGESKMELEDGTHIEVKRSYELHWDAPQLEEDLRALGMPEKRIREIVVETVSHKVKAVEANKASKANPEYAEAIERARTEVEKMPTIGLPRA